MLNCVCGAELDWRGDHSDDYDPEWAMESQYEYPKCKRGVIIYTPREVNECD
jgi:hypothetical protein